MSIMVNNCNICNSSDSRKLLKLFDTFQTNIFLERIYSGMINTRNLDIDVYQRIAMKLTDGVFEGFGTNLIRSNFGTPNYAMLESLRENVYIFSAAKTYQQTRSISQLLTTEEGGLKSHADFMKEAKEKFDIYNSDYLTTEYNSAIMQARSAAQWMEIQRDMDIYDQLQYHTVGDMRVRPDHQALDNIIRPVNDRFWSVFMPPNGWNCFDDKTSIYTNNGWKLFSELNESDLVYTLNTENKIPEFQRPINYIKKYHNGKLLKIKANNFSSITTNEHKLLVNKGWNRKCKKEDLKLIDAKDIASGDRIYKSSKWIGNRVDYIEIGCERIDIETYVKFMGWYLSEGSITKRSENSYQIKISQSDKKYLSLIYDDLKNMPYNVYLAKDYVGINDVELGQYLIQFGKSFEKYVPQNIKDLTPELISLFLDRYIKGDGNIQKGKDINGYEKKDIESIYTSSYKMCGDLNELIIKIGKSSNIKLYETKDKSFKHMNGDYISNHNIWRIMISNSHYFNISKKHISYIDYDGYVYCVEVPKYNTLLVMNNGKISWSGNCRCTVLQMSGEENTNLKSKEIPSYDDVPDIFRFNPGEKKQIFSPKHPYFDVARGDKSFAKTNFGLPLPQRGI